ncbi:hypothetical protein [Hyphomonas sp.]|uniref:hypothetical protein n=1 Tax=Hyphomonas sp. TaxID=87 RepID=UPI0025B7C6B1|nr:hypothetical protein [Hyphomonas sp.]
MSDPTNTRAPSLDALRDLIHREQSNRAGASSNPAQKIVATRDGRLITGDQAANQPVTTVQTDTFAYPNLSRDRDYAITHMPPGTVEVTLSGVTGWRYAFINEYGEPFDMFAFYDGSYYQVLLLQPELEARWMSPHTGHIYSDGRICFGTSYNSGRKTLGEAYAKSVLWATGITVALQGFPFPWNVNQ